MEKRLKVTSIQRGAAGVTGGESGTNAESSEVTLQADEIALQTWKPIVGFPPYEVSNIGQVRRPMRAKSNRGKYKYRKWCFATSGYPHVGLSCGTRDVTRTIHSLVAEAFIGPRPPGMQINHKDGNKNNPSVENLEYVSAAYNTQHAYDNGLTVHPRGEDWCSAKLTDREVVAIRKLHACGIKLAHLADAFGVSITTTHAIVNRKIWSHL